MLITLIVVMVLCVFAPVQIHQIVYIKYMQFFAYQLYLHETVKVKKKKLIIQP